MVGKARAYSSPLKKHLSLWFKTLSGSENLAFEVLSEKTYFSRANQWQLRQKLEVRRQ